VAIFPPEHEEELLAQRPQSATPSVPPVSEAEAEQGATGSGETAAGRVMLAVSVASTAVSVVTSVAAANARRAHQGSGSPAVLAPGAPLRNSMEGAYCILLLLLVAAPLKGIRGTRAGGAAVWLAIGWLVLRFALEQMGFL
jgi:hypothetical protein